MKKLIMLAGLAIVLGGCTYKGRGLTVGDGFNLIESDWGYEEYIQLQQGCGGKDCIQVIDEPAWEIREAADKWLGDEDVVLGLDYKGEHRAYPVKILNWHEIVNDRVAGDPVVVTYSSWCGSGLVFMGAVPMGRFNEELTFGVSGKLKHGCPVMYDRKKLGLWEELTGKWIAGKFMSLDLVQIPVQILSWQEWKKGHPATTVLLRPRGGNRDYEVDPYANQGEVVYGVRVGGKAKAYTLTAIKRETADDGVLMDTVGGERLRISYRDGEILVENLRARNKVIATRMFRFAWEAYYPETEIDD